MPQPEYVQRGYLREDFRLFHLKGPMEEQLDWHYHTFHKLIFFLGGTSSYGLEGRSYPLEAGDVILVPQGCVHRPEAAPGAPYERVILYLSAEFLSRAGGADCPLDSCFTLAKTSFRFVLRPQDDRQALRQTLANLEQAQQPGFGQSALAQAILVQLLILLRRSMDAQPQAVPSLAADEKIAAITGETPLLFRPPYGDYNDTVIRTVRDCGMYAIQWDVDSLDWKDPTPEEICQRVLKRVQPGSIILFHNEAKNTPAALPSVIEGLIRQGYEIVPVSQLIYREDFTMDHTGRQIPN